MTTDPWGALLLILLVFLVGREITCWYFKSTEIVELLKKIEKHLSKD